jgi:hypothetical protein
MAKDDQYVDEVEEEQGDGLSTALVVVTSLVLIAAFILVEMALKSYGRGLFAGG